MGLDGEPLPPSVRDDLLAEAGHCCQLCGTAGTEHGGTARLEAHHIVPLDRGGTHAIDNLTVLCRSCHSWFHSLSRLRTAEAEFGSISYEPSPVDLQIVLAVAAHGPSRTRVIAETAGTSVETASQRLMKLTALEVVEPTKDLHDHTASAKWDFRGLVEDSAVGELPEDSKKAARLARDEMMRRRADRGDSHQQIAEDLGITRRTVIKSIDRARALKPPVPDLHPTDSVSLSPDGRLTEAD